MPGLFRSAPAATESLATAAAAYSSKLLVHRSSPGRSTIQLKRVARTQLSQQPAILRKGNDGKDSQPHACDLLGWINETAAETSFLRWACDLLAQEEPTALARIKGCRRLRTEIQLDESEPTAQLVLPDGTTVYRQGSSVVYLSPEGCITTILSNGFCDTVHPTGWRAHRNPEDGEVRLFDRDFQNCLKLDGDDRITGMIMRNGVSCTIDIEAAQLRRLFKR